MSRSSSRRRIHREIRALQALKKNIVHIIQNINFSFQSLEQGKNQIRDIYTINDENTPIMFKIVSLSKDISETSNYLKRVVIPDIENRIEELYDELASLDDDD